MKSVNQEIRIIRKNGSVRVTGNGDMYTWTIASGIIHRGEMQPRKRDLAKKFVHCLVGAIKWEAEEKAQKLNEIIVGTEEAVTEFYPISGYLN